MQTAQMNSPRFSFQTPVPVPGTLDNFRVVHDNYASSGSFSAKAMRPVWIAALLIAAGAGIAFGVNTYSENSAAKTESAAIAADPSVPAASSVPATSNMPMAAEAPTAKDSPVTDPLKPLTKSQEANSMPLAGHGNNHSSESLNPVKAKSSVAAKSAPVAPGKAAPALITPANEVAPLPLETAPPSPPAPAIIEPLPVPAPAPITPPVEPPPQ